MSNTELAEEAGVPPRRIRYFIQRGLIPRPKGGGRAYYYTEEYLSRIRTIKEWSTQGVPLKKIEEILLAGILSPSLGLVGASMGVLETQRWIEVKIGSQTKKVSFKTVVRTTGTTPKAEAIWKPKRGKKRRNIQWTN